MTGKIYTRTGDKGETSLFGGKRVSKASLRVDSYGTVDELNSAIGVAIAESQRSKVKSILEDVQHDLLTIGSRLASPEKTEKLGLEQRVTEFERQIDILTEKLPQLRHFILPGGGRTGAHLHLARTIARRAERRIIALSQEAVVDNEVLMYFNRLSDLLFTLARFVNHSEGEKETIWTK